VDPLRLAVVALIGAGLLLGTLATRWWLNTRRTALRATPVASLWSALDTEADGRVTIVAFSSPSCAACHTAQAPALRQLQRTLDVRVLQVDIAAQPAVARAFGIMTVPATVLLTADGLREINHGFRSSRQLARQVELVIDPRAAARAA
jgi:thioredoxin-like negative regulator of GroEL